MVPGEGQRGGPAPGRPPRRGQDRLHRLDRGGPADHGRLRGPREAAHPGAGRQERQHRLRRRRPGAGGGLGPMAVFDNAGQDCCARSRILVERAAYDRFLEPAGGGGRPGAGRRPGRRRHRDGAAHLGRHRERVASYVPEDAPVAFQGQAPDGPGFWFPPTVLAPVARPTRPYRGGVRPGGGGGPVRRRGRRRPARQRHALRAVRARSGPRTWAGAAGGPRRRDRQPVGQLALVGPLLDAVRRLQALGPGARAGPRRPRRLHRGQERVHRHRPGG